VISIDTGGSGGYGVFYIYAFKNNVLQELFNVDLYNAAHTFKVNYEDYYKVRVQSARLKVMFIIDISNRGKDYLTQFYDRDGRLKKQIEGSVLSLGTLYPIITNPNSTTYDLMARQRIIGPTNSDTLGYVENLLTWNADQFISTRIALSIPNEM